MSAVTASFKTNEKVRNMIVFKVIGCICVLVSCTLYGRNVASRYHQYVQALRQIYLILFLLKGEIAYTRAPLAETIRQVNEQLQEPYNSWLTHLIQELNHRSANNFDSLWKETIESDLIGLNLKTEHKNLLFRYGQHLGTLDYDTEIKNLQLILERWNQEICAEEEGLKSKQKLCHYLGVLIGLFLVILLV